MEPNCKKCLRNSFKILVGSTDRKHMTITDASEWMEDLKPDNFEITITDVAHEITGTIEILAKGTNILSSKELFGTKDKICLQDGFYCLKCESCGKKYTINRVFLANTECMIDHLFVKANDSEEIQKVNDLYNDLKMIQINTEIGRLNTAEKIYKSLQKKLNTLGCNECTC